MKANELRIGNLLKDTYSVEWVVSGIHEFGVDCFNDNEETYMEYENFEPILLTEEWLLKFGFEKLSQIPQYFINDLHIYKTENIFKIYGLIMFNIKIKYVHQLQNLYFALTNEELTIKTK